MEGRRPPPKASHPFPDYANMRKFWNTPLSGAFFRSLATFISIYGSYLAINIYLTRHEEGFLGFKLTGTPEQFKKRFAIMEAKSKLIPLGSPNIRFNIDDESKDLSLRFDDGISFNRKTIDLPFLNRRNEKE